MNELEYFLDKEFANIVFNEDKFVIGEYENCKFNKCNFSNIKLSENIFINCEFINCELTNANISATVFRDVIFNNCNLTGLQFSTCNQLLFSIGFNGCRLNMSSFLE